MKFLPVLVFLSYRIASTGFQDVVSREFITLLGQCGVSAPSKDTT
jgi:hypothetical protein